MDLCFKLKHAHLLDKHFFPSMSDEEREAATAARQTQAVLGHVSRNAQMLRDAISTARKLKLTLADDLARKLSELSCEIKDFLSAQKFDV